MFLNFGYQAINYLFGSSFGVHGLTTDIHKFTDLLQIAMSNFFFKNRN